MPLIPVNDLNDTRLEFYRNIKERELARQSGRFLAEGHYLVLRLLGSDFPVESILVDERKLRLIEGALRPDVPVYVAPPGLVDQVIGYAFHVGVIAVGMRKPQGSLGEFMERVPERGMLVVCSDLRSTENLGSIIRTAAGFGAGGLIVGEQSCDPFYRQCVRVSMGTIFYLPIFRSQHLAGDLQWLKEQWHIELIATVLDSAAENLAGVVASRRAALLFGSEDQGLSPEIVALADRKVTLPMAWNTDSLNVSIAAGIFLYHFTLKREDVKT